MADLSPYPDSNDDTRVRSAPGSPPSTPRWVKVFAIVALILVLLFVIIMFTGLGGPHGPGRHLPSGDVGSAAPLSSVIEDPTPLGSGLGGNISFDDPDDPILSLEHREQQL